MSDREAIRLALEALYESEPGKVYYGGSGNPEKAKSILRDRLAAPPDAELEALQRDAERYRWLRGMIYDDRVIVEADRMLHGEALDAAIDAAMKGDKP